MSHKMLLLLMTTLLATASARPAKTAAQAPLAKPSAATGRLHLTFTERSPLSARDQILRRIDVDPQSKSLSPKMRANVEYDLANESFEVFVPPAYRGDVAYGLFLWNGVGEVPPAWQEVFSRRKLIWISANNTRGRWGFVHIQLRLDAVHNMKKAYKIDENRVYAAGFSAGGGQAATMVCGFPDVFRGGYFLMGGRFYMTRRNESGRWDTTVERLTPTWKGPLDQIKKDLRLVLMRGEIDSLYSPAEDRGQWESLLLDGFTRVTFIEVPRLGHDLPSASWFERGIVALEKPKPRTAPTTSPTTQPHPLPGQIAQAQRLLATAQLHLDRQKQHNSARAAGKAREYLRQVIEQYPTTPAAAKARQILERAGEGDSPQLLPAPSSAGPARFGCVGLGILRR